MVLIATGSLLLRIMEKSIPGTAQGSVHASVYKSEANSNVLQQYRQNIKTGCSREDHRDQMEEPSRNKGGKENDAEEGPWFKAIQKLHFHINFVLIQDVTKARPDAGLLTLNQMWAGLWFALCLSHCSSSFELAVRSELAGRAETAAVAFPLPGRRKAGCRQMRACMLKNNDSGCTFSTKQSQPVNCDTVPKTATLNKPSAKQS